MECSQQQKVNQGASSLDEQILVVPRGIIMSDQEWYGLRRVDCSTYLSLIREHQQFLPRYLMEEDDAYKQIIPYLVFRHKHRYFLMQRSHKSSEKRLGGRYTLGIGGHIRQEDIAHESIEGWATREFHEEILYNGSMTIVPLGMLNDDTDLVGRVHLGFVFIVNADSDIVSIKSELVYGELKTLEECLAYRDRMEGWSVFVLDYLKENEGL